MEGNKPTGFRQIFFKNEKEIKTGSLGHYWEEWITWDNCNTVSSSVTSKFTLKIIICVSRVPTCIDKISILKEMLWKNIEVLSGLHWQFRKVTWKHCICFWSLRICCFVCAGSEIKVSFGPVSQCPGKLREAQGRVHKGAGQLTTCCLQGTNSTFSWWNIAYCLCVIDLGWGGGGSRVSYNRFHIYLEGTKLIPPPWLNFEFSLISQCLVRLRL